MRILFATQFEYRLNESALGSGLPLSLHIMPSLVRVGYAIPDPKVLVKMLPSETQSLHLPSTSY